MDRSPRVDPEAGTVSAERKLRASGNSVVITIPPQVLEGAGLAEGDVVRLVADMNGGDITIALADEAEDGSD
jgi:antitoxin component of MazEF toxin-antitoxin module